MYSRLTYHTLIFFSLLCGCFTLQANELTQEEWFESLFDETQLPERAATQLRYRHMWNGYETFISKKFQFMYFRVFKAATGTLTHFFRDQDPSLEDVRLTTLPKKAERYFKFAFVRNTWDRIVSCYFHKVVTKADPSFESCFDKDFDYFVDYINKLDLSVADRHLRLQTLLIPYKECDFIGRIDNFNEDLQHICDVIGLEMLHVSHKHQTEHVHYSAYYTPRTQRIIARKYKEEIEVFGFTFDRKD